MELFWENTITFCVTILVVTFIVGTTVVVIFCCANIIMGCYKWMMNIYYDIQDRKNTSIKMIEKLYDQVKRSIREEKR